MTFYSSLRHMCLTLICGLSFHSISAQLYLDVDLIPQENSQWCWAASMEMLMKYHNYSAIGPDVQCSLAKNYVETAHRVNSYFPFSGIHPANACYNLCDGTVVNPAYNRPILSPLRGRKLQIMYWNLLFAQHGFYAVENLNTEFMSWRNIKSEIAACRPFVVSLNRVNSITSRLFNHAVVVKGYYEYATLNDEKFVVANDPLTSLDCKGCETLFPIDIFTDSPNKLFSALEIVHLIQPQAQSICTSCDERTTIPSVPLVDALNEDDNSDILSKIDNSFTDTELNDLSTTYSTEFFIEDIFYYTIAPDFSAVIEEDVKILVTDATTPGLAFYLTKTGTDWTIRKIIEADCTPFKRYISLNGGGEDEGSRPESFEQTQTIDPNSTPSELNHTEFDLIEILPNFEQFYRYGEEKEYWIPVKSYPSLGLEKGQSYKKRFVKRQFRKRECSERKIFNKTERELKKNIRLEDRIFNRDA